MSGQDSLDHIDMIIESIINDNAHVVLPSVSSTARIPRVPGKSRDDYEKDYVPKVVSIGPYHHGNPKLESAQKLKPVYTRKLVGNDHRTLKCLYYKLGEPQMVLDLRSFYEEHSTDMFCDEDFTKMMLLDSCFILFYISYILYSWPPPHEFKDKEIECIKRDLFLLENQIPFKVLKEVTEFLNIKQTDNFRRLIYGDILSTPKRKLVSWLQFMLRLCRVDIYERSPQSTLLGTNNPPDHLLHLLYHRVTCKVHTWHARDPAEDYDYSYNLGNVKELVDVGINFKPSDISSFANVKFVKGWWGFSANVELPTLIIEEFTKPKLLNLIAYEICSLDYHACVSSYVSLLHSLIEQPEDVKVLRKAQVLENCSRGSDKDVVELFHGIADANLFPILSLPYMEVKLMMKSHYESWRSTLFSQLKHEYLKSPWSYLALLGALVALFLSAVQTYFTVWSPGQK